MENYRVDPKLRAFVRKYEYPIWWLAWVISGCLSLVTVLLVMPKGSQAILAVGLVANAAWSLLICVCIPFITGFSKHSVLQILLSPGVPLLLSMPFLRTIENAKKPFFEQWPDWLFFIYALYFAIVVSYIYIRLGQFEVEMMEKLEHKLSAVKGIDLPNNTFDLDRSKRAQNLMNNMETISVVDGTTAILNAYSEKKDRFYTAWLRYGILPPSLLILPIFLIVILR